MRREVPVAGNEVEHVHQERLVSDDYATLKRQVDGLEREVKALFVDQSRHEQRSEGAGPVVKDARWPCSKCGSLLGFYDSNQDVLRTRYKDHTVYVHLGEGGWVTVLCRSCGELNTQQYVDTVPVEGE